MKKPKLRPSNYQRDPKYPLGEIPDDVLRAVGRSMVYWMAVGVSDVSGDQFGDIFANAVGGTHYGNPVGVVDVGCDDTGWSVKTVKRKDPFSTRILRLISGRNSPDFSYNISDPREDIQATGKAVLSIWNERVSESLKSFHHLRTVVLMRNFEDRKFVLFEHAMEKFAPEDYSWRVNARGNLEGREKATGEDRFVWQPHGSQFTIREKVPKTIRSFYIAHRVETFDPDDVLDLIDYSDEWVILKDG